MTVHFCILLLLTGSQQHKIHNIHIYLSKPPFLLSTCTSKLLTWQPLLPSDTVHCKLGHGTHEVIWNQGGCLQRGVCQRGGLAAAKPVLDCRSLVCLAVSNQHDRILHALLHVASTLDNHPHFDRKPWQQCCQACEFIVQAGAEQTSSQIR